MSTEPGNGVGLRQVFGRLHNVPALLMADISKQAYGAREPSKRLGTSFDIFANSR